MPRSQTEAIVLRTFPIGDQDKIAVFLTVDRGLLKGVAKGARKFGNRFGSSLEPMSHVKVLFYEKENQELVTVGQCDLIESNFELQSNLEMTYNLCYFAELIEISHPTKDRDDILFRLILNILRKLKEGGDREFLAAYFEAWFLKINGLLPHLAHCRRCRKEIISEAWLAPSCDGGLCVDCASSKKEEIDRGIPLFLKWARTNPPPGKEEVPFGNEQIRLFRKTLQTILVFHLEKVPKSLAFLK